MSGAEAVATFMPGRTLETVRCHSVRARLAGEVLGTWPLPPAARQHFDECLTCQAQAARYRVVLRALRSLRQELEEAPQWLLEHVLSSLDRPERRQPNRARTALAVSAVAASVAVVGAAALIRWARSGSV